MPKLRVLTAALLLALAAPAPGRAEEPADSIRGVISAQIEAFLADDFARAFTFASPAIRGIFQTPENFGRMVRNGYPMVWRPSEVRMGPLATRNGRLVQSVILRDAAGALFIADYEMVEVDGAWRINGVWIRRAEDMGA